VSSVSDEKKEAEKRTGAWGRGKKTSRGRCERKERAKIYKR